MPYRVFALSAVMLALTLAAGGPVIAQDAQDTQDVRTWISPSEGATRTSVELSAEGLPGLSEVSVLAGPDPERLRPVGRAAADPQGTFTMALRVPAEAARGERYYFAIDPEGKEGPILAEPPFKVIIREGAPPGGA